jgi:tetratricopeptide (TPR) repeat protein
MKLLSLLVLGSLALPCVCVADIVVLKDGTTVEGEIRRTGDSYIVKGAGGAVTNIATDKVERIEVRPAGGADAAVTRLQSLRRASENMADIRQILDRYRAFIDQNPGTAAGTSAENELKLWQDRLDRGMVKVGEKWMTPDERDGLRSKSTDVAIVLHDMLKQGRLKESTPILDHAIQVDPSNMSLLYLHGVLNYQEEKLQPSRKSFEGVAAVAPDHAPTLNNLAVILWRQNAHPAALIYYDRAMLAAPVTGMILDNVAEALNALPKEQRDSAIVKKLLRHFKEQDEALQKKMAESGLYRWGSSWVNETELKKLQADEKVIKDQITQMEQDFGSLQKRVRDLDRQIADIVNQMNIIDAQTYAPGPNGTSTRLPYPPVWFTLQAQVSALRTERGQRIDDMNRLRGAAKQALGNMPQPKYSGLQKLIDFDGMPLPAGYQPPSTQPSGGRATAQ